MAFSFRHLFATTRWVPPFLFYLFWLMIAVQSPVSVYETSAFLFPALVPATSWLTLIVGNLDDTPHRELLSAAIGGPVRLHLTRNVAGLALSLGVGSVSILLAVINAGGSDLQAIATGMLTLAAASTIGVAFASLLQPPINDQVGIAVVVCLGALFLLMVFPVTQWSIRQLNDQLSIGALVLGGGGLALLLLAQLAAPPLIRKKII